MKFLSIISILMTCVDLAAQETVQLPLSPAEHRHAFFTSSPDKCRQETLLSNPAWTATEIFVSDSASHRAIVYSGLSNSDTEGDFMHYEGTGATDWRIGASGVHGTPHIGTLSGCIQYARGKHRNIGWSAMRMPELYLPYISTDSCGGDFKFDSYLAEGTYAFATGTWTLGARASFYGEQAWRLSAPRAQNNTTWLRFSAGATRQLGQHLIMFSMGYGRNKQHEQLRYWRPGQQDRFFVCYGFGLYDTRQSAVSFGKARMYYIDEFTASLQYLSPITPHPSPLTLHASLAYYHHIMSTEESDIYNLYESRTNTLLPQIQLTWQPTDAWTITLSAEASLYMRKGYENIFEEYLANADYNSYDFRTIDSQQNYTSRINQTNLALTIGRKIACAYMSVSGGIATCSYEDKYKGGMYNIKVNTATPYVSLASNWHIGMHDRFDLSARYGRQTVGTHHYDVEMQNTKIKHLDFQQAFAPYAYRAADLTLFSLSFTWEHSFHSLTSGLTCSYYLASGERCSDASYGGTIGYASTAPILSPTPDIHKEHRGSITTYVRF